MPQALSDTTCESSIAVVPCAGAGPASDDDDDDDDDDAAAAAAAACDAAACDDDDDGGACACDAEVRLREAEPLTGSGLTT